MPGLARLPLEDIKAMPAEIERLQAIVEPLEELRNEEGSRVEIMCDNADFNDLPNSHIRAYGDWTNGEGEVFTGDNLAAALKAGVEAKRAAEAKENTHD